MATIIARRQQTVYAAGTFVFLLAALFFGLVYMPFPSAYVRRAHLGRTKWRTGPVVLSGPGDNDPRTSLLFGGVAGFVFSLAYLIPQWVGGSGVLQPKAHTVSATDKIQFASAVLGGGFGRF